LRCMKDSYLLFANCHAYFLFLMAKSMSALWWWLLGQGQFLSSAARGEYSRSIWQGQVWRSRGHGQSSRSRAHRLRHQELELEKKKQELYELLRQADAANNPVRTRTRLLAGRFIEQLASQFELSSWIHVDADNNLLWCVASVFVSNIIYGFPWFSLCTKKLDFMYALLITTCIYRCWQCYHSQPVQRKEGYHNLTRLKQAIIAHNCHFLPFSFSLLLQELHRLLWWGYHEHITDCSESDE
jgi:hypothetical protein